MVNRPAKRRCWALLTLLSVASLGIFLWYEARLNPARQKAEHALSGENSKSPKPAAHFEIKGVSENLYKKTESLSELAARLTYASGWAGEKRKGFVEFKNWAELYAVTRDSNEKRELVADGVALAKSRRILMAALIKNDPRGALAATVPATIRAQLPGAITSLLEERVAGKGDFNVLASTAAPGQPDSQPIIHEATINGTDYSASVYGRREFEATKEDVSLHGVALDGTLALHESPIRVLEPGEAVAAASSLTSVCPVSGLATSLPAVAPETNTTEPTVIEVGGQPAALCHIMHLQTLETNLTNAESGLGPKALAASGDTVAVTTGTPTGRDLSWSIGVKKVLVIRVDFSDVPGTPIDKDNGQTITADYALQLFTNSVSPYYAEGSYNQTSLVATIDPNVYRMPKAAATYVVDQLGFLTLLSDAKALAAATETLADYDRIAVVFSNLQDLPNSTFTWGGYGYIGDSGVWINGWYNLAAMAHELGHNYGLNHANLWQIKDGNPLSLQGSSSEYGDIFDVMGFGYDANAQFNPWHKSQLGWLPDQAINTVTTSGVYRVYRFDDAGASFGHSLAVKIARDGVRNYWIGLRKKFTSNASLSNGAYIIWGYSGVRQSDLLDLTTPGNDATDAALAPGATLNDIDYGINITTIGIGGTSPNEYIDVQITLSLASALPASGIGPSGFQANWSGALALGATGYRLDVATDAAFTQFVPGFQDTLFTVETSEPVTGLKQATTYYYRVRTVTSAGTSASSSTASVTTGTASYAPVQTVALGGSITLTGPDTATAGSTYVWTHNLLPLSGAAAASLALNNFGLHDGGFYQATATGTDGTVVSKKIFVNAILSPAQLAILGLSSADPQGELNIPSGLGNFSAVAVGFDNIVALKSDGTVMAWGGDNSGDSDVPAGLNNVVSISAGSGFTIALKSDGTLAAWGNNTYGACNVPTGAVDIVAVAAGYNHALALKSDGTVFTWGASNLAQQLAVPFGLNHVVAIAAGNSISAALKDDGTVVTWGASAPPAPALLNHVVAIAGGPAVFYALKDDGTVASWGAGIEGDTDVPANLNHVVQIASGNNAGLAVKEDETLVGWGHDSQLLSTPYANVLSVVGSYTDVAAVILDNTAKPHFATGVLQNQTVSAGTSATFQVGTEETASYQWQESSDQGSTWNTLSDNSQDSGTATATLTVSGSSLQMDGQQYRAIAMSSGISTISSAVTLSVYDPNAARLINLSTRSFVGFGEDIQIAGFIISGTAPKTVLIRAGGPSLSPYGVTGFLADPVLTLYSGQTVVATNDDWDATTIQPAQTALNTTTWTPGSKDAALLVTLAPGGYTAQVTGKNGTTGIALIEVYEYDRTQSTAKLINISTRSFVGTDANIQIAGFIISGSAPKKVLIRAGGPSLAPFGIAAPLADPVLTLYSGQTVMTSNDDWDAATIQPIESAAGVSPWTPGSKDAALVLTLAPGGYTAQVTGKANGTGVALIEVYELP